MIGYQVQFSEPNIICVVSVCIAKGGHVNGTCCHVQVRCNIQHLGHTYKRPIKKVAIYM